MCLIPVLPPSKHFRCTLRCISIVFLVALSYLNTAPVLSNGRRCLLNLLLFCLFACVMLNCNALYFMYGPWYGLLPPWTAGEACRGRFDEGLRSQAEPTVQVGSSSAPCSSTHQTSRKTAEKHTEILNYSCCLSNPGRQRCMLSPFISWFRVVSLFGSDNATIMNTQSSVR